MRYGQPMTPPKRTPNAGGNWLCSRWAEPAAKFEAAVGAGGCGGGGVRDGHYTGEAFAKYKIAPRNRKPIRPRAGIGLACSYAAISYGMRFASFGYSLERKSEIGMQALPEFISMDRSALR